MENSNNCLNIQTYNLNGYQELLGHFHNSTHICFIIDGEFSQRYKNTNIECNKDIVRVSASHSIHDIFTSSTGANVLIINFPKRFQLNLDNRSDTSSFLSSLYVSKLKFNLIEAWYNLNYFDCERIALELVARSVSSNKTDQPPSWLEEFKEELLNNSLNSYSLKKLSSRFNRHRSHVSKTFKKWYGITPGTLLRDYHLSIARRQLEKSDRSIAQIAFENGFTDQSHFSKVFLQKFGNSPARFRSTIS